MIIESIFAKEFFCLSDGLAQEMLASAALIQGIVDIDFGRGWKIHLYRETNCFRPYIYPQAIKFRLRGRLLDLGSYAEHYGKLGKIASAMHPIVLPISLPT